MCFVFAMQAIVLFLFCWFQGHYRFEGAAFPSVAELIAWQRNSGVPVTARSGALLRRAVPRENWELNNDDVQLLDKIGRVSFASTASR